VTLCEEFSPIVFEDIRFDRRAYDPWLAYGQSKTANILFAVEATTRWASDGITVNALIPGMIQTNLSHYLPQEELDRAKIALTARRLGSDRI